MDGAVRLLASCNSAVSSDGAHPRVPPPSRRAGSGLPSPEYTAVRSHRQVEPSAWMVKRVVCSMRSSAEVSCGVRPVEVPGRQ